jgi:hypothetical protein
MNLGRLPSEVSESVSASWTAAVEQAKLVPESEHRAQDHGYERGPCKRECERVQPLEVVVDEHGEADEREHGRQSQRLPPFVPGLRDLATRLPGRAREQHARSHPADVEELALDVRLRGGLVEVDAVRDGEAREARGDQHPRPIQPPPVEGDDADQHREQQQVEQRVGEVGGDDELRAAGLVEDGVEDDGSAEGRDDETADDPVQPETPVQLLDAPAQQQSESDVRERVEGEVEAVGERRERDLLAPRQEERVVEVAGRPESGRETE